ncbi:MAG TPA: PHB depolymerase family esterase [Nitrolancea sp.]|nr:PHB depolymerase family esterase [Nitrolancea sp.]
MTLVRRSITVAGRPRSYLLSEPAGAAAGIVLNLHGSRSRAEQQAMLSRMESLTATQHAVVAFPQAETPDRNGFKWDHAGDVEFLRELTGQLLRQYPASGERVCICGMSGGARMSCVFASKHAELVAAVGAVGGLRAPSIATPVRRVPVIAFHGTADRINPYAGGLDERWDESVPEATRRWAMANGVAETSSEARIGKSLTRTTYGVEGQPGEVTLWTIDGAGHIWPGGSARLFLRLLLGPVSQEINATDEIWRFYQRHVGAV